MYEPENDRSYDPMNTQRGTDENRRRVGEFAANGEYHFTRGETTRVGYSDAGYVPSSEASEIPPRYHYAEPSVPKEKKTKEKKQRHSPGLRGFIAACLVCAILGGAAGGAVVGLAQSREAAAVSDSAGTNEANGTVKTPDHNETAQDTPAKQTPSVVTSTTASTGKTLTGTEVYDLATTQVVAITTEITYTNYFGFTSSAAVSGSGFIISSDGYILTNHHVIEDAVQGGYEVTVLLYDGSEYTATVIGYDGDYSDVAVLKIDAEGLNPVTVGDSDAIRVGESVYAVGNPLGELQFSMSTGSVSALDREVSSSDGSTINMFQIDAAVNKGNSGGPAYNDRGEVIGIVTAKYSDSGVEGLGFAIPINDAMSIAEDLITNGYVSGKAYIGILNPQDINATYAQYYNMVPGVYVYGVQSGSAAENAGLKPGDIVVALGSEEIDSTSALNAAKREYKAGDTTTIRVYRSGEYFDLTITFDEETPNETVTQPQQGGANGYGYGFGGQR